MRNGRIETLVVSGWVNQFATTAMWLGLCSQDPSAVDDPLTVEVVGSVYRRPAAYWQNAGPTLLRNSTPYAWNGLVPGTIVACVTAWDAAFNGRLLAVMPLDEPQMFPAGGSFSLASGELYVGVDV